jgi:hypothetical protein
VADLWIGQPACWGLCRESIFSGVVRSVQRLMASERLPRTWTARKKHMCGVRGLVREAYVLCVSDFSL